MKRYEVKRDIKTHIFAYIFFWIFILTFILIDGLTPEPVDDDFFIEFTGEIILSFLISSVISFIFVYFGSNQYVEIEDRRK